MAPSSKQAAATLVLLMLSPLVRLAAGESKPKPPKEPYPGYSCPPWVPSVMDYRGGVKALQCADGAFADPCCAYVTCEAGCVACTGGCRGSPPPVCRRETFELMDSNSDGKVELNEYMLYMVNAFVPSDFRNVSDIGKLAKLLRPNESEKKGKKWLLKKKEAEKWFKDADVNKDSVIDQTDCDLKDGKGKKDEKEPTLIVQTVISTSVVTETVPEKTAVVKNEDTGKVAVVKNEDTGKVAVPPLREPENTGRTYEFGK